MKTIEISLYSFNELSEKAKEKALSIYQTENQYFWENEALESLKAFFDEIGLFIINYQIDWYCPNNSWVRYEGKTNGKFIKKYFTGYCLDYPLSSTWNKTKDVEKSLWAFFLETQKDYEHQLSEEYFSEYCEANEIYFDEKGNQF